MLSEWQSRGEPQESATSSGWGLLGDREAVRKLATTGRHRHHQWPELVLKGLGTMHKYRPVVAIRQIAHRLFWCRFRRGQNQIDPARSCGHRKGERPIYRPYFS